MVSDDGQGIDPKDYQTVFIPFTRLDKSRSRKTGGLGVGLAITKGACKKIKAEISISQSHLGGARFDLRIPL
ncbi:ATP-binding protein [Psychrobium sp. 1_MG-2023]|uniref:ATP-binding protein n=1 Tax=Psychrobium sp. 1_MG-2023 TaxID=3062624 RepID=UPI00268DC471|nr:ATP-binding protein [Psychrobium sp. 1_MG-2023]MDP2561525.1 ATP-binding protein [Psychrobium sp. 1_MG-2023]